jgi:hypothetical protein
MRFTSPHTPAKFASPIDTPFVRKSTVTIAGAPPSSYVTSTRPSTPFWEIVTFCTDGTAFAAHTAAQAASATHFILKGIFCILNLLPFTIST